MEHVRRDDQDECIVEQPDHTRALPVLVERCTLTKDQLAKALAATALVGLRLQKFMRAGKPGRPGRFILAHAASIQRYPLRRGGRTNTK